MKVGLVQYSPVWENKESSMLRIKHILKGIDPDIDLIVFPEMTLTGFTMRSAKFAEDMSGASASFFSDLAKEQHSHVIAGIIEKNGPESFNSLLHLDRSGMLLQKYQKIHPFSVTGENRHYSAGEGPAVTSIDGIQTGLSICYDLRFPELYRLYVLLDARLMVNIANWPIPRIEHWHTLLKARAIENQAFVIGVNRVGSDKANKYCGWSAVFDPSGREICCQRDLEQVITVSFSINEVEGIRKKFPFLQDIRLVKTNRQATATDKRKAR